jgi:hypothetical protein
MTLEIAGKTSSVGIFADHLGILVFYPEDLDLKPDDIEQLTKRDADSWSG